MSDKVTKIRINGIEKEIGGGSGSGGVSGAYLAPITLVSVEYNGFEQAAVDPIALVEQLEKAGISVDEPAFDPNESSVSLTVGHMYTSGGNNLSIIDLYISRSSLGGFTVHANAMGSYIDGEVPDDKTTLRAIINYIFTEMSPEFHFTLNYTSGYYGYLENFINIYYQDVYETLHYYISNMTEFCEEVIIEYNPSSGSDSGSGN